MHWNDIVGHKEWIERFRQMVHAGRLPSSFLFSGPAGIGKRTFAFTLAQGLLCEGLNHDGFEPCEHCAACQQVAARSHPDLIVVGRPKDKAQIPIEAFVGADGKMQEGLCHDFSLKPFRGGRKIAIIDDADFINQEGANSLLKTLEEPPPGAVLILIGTSPQKQLPTIRSRCQLVSFAPLSVGDVEAVLKTRRLIEDLDQANELARLSAGSLELALLMADPAIRDFRSDWLRQLSTGDPGEGGFTKRVMEFIDGAGSESAAKRDRMRLVCDWAVEFYRSVQLANARCDLPYDDPTLAACVEQASATIGTDFKIISQCLARCLDAHTDIGLNLNQALWVECLLSDLQRIAAGSFVATAYV